MPKDLVDKILDKADAQRIVDKVQKKLKEEAKQRDVFYKNITEQEKVEFIKGQIIAHSPVKKAHSDASFNLATLLKIYVDKNDLGYVAHEKNHGQADA
ncbi:MAG: hypothetical protein HC880_13190 [Bacteroidia bacterium]|nr:hypothetical protein [Bacteroidia bacterium]